MTRFTIMEATCFVIVSIDIRLSLSWYEDLTLLTATPLCYYSSMRPFSHDVQYLPEFRLQAWPHEGSISLIEPLADRVTIQQPQPAHQHCSGMATSRRRGGEGVVRGDSLTGPEREQQQHSFHPSLKRTPGLSETMHQCCSAHPPPLTRCWTKEQR